MKIYTLAISLVLRNISSTVKLYHLKQLTWLKTTVFNFIMVHKCFTKKF